MNLPFSADNQAMLAALAAFVALFLFCMGAIRILRQRSYRKEMVTRIRGGGTASTTTPKRCRWGWFQGRFLDRAHVREDRQTRLSSGGKRVLPCQAEVPAGRDPQRQRSGRHWGVKIVFAVVFPAAFIVARILALGGLSNETTIAAAVSCALSGFYLPDICLNRRAERRRLRILEALPGAIDLLVICVEAGMGLDSAISKVAEEISIGASELGDEFKLMNLELRAGKQRTEALKNLAARTNLDEISSLTTLMIQTDKFGTSMADALRVYSESYRTQRYQSAEEVAAKLPVKMVIPLVFFIFPSLFLVILGPAAINIYRTLIKDVLAR